METETAAACQKVRIEVLWVQLFVWPGVHLDVVPSRHYAQGVVCVGYL